MKRRGIAGGVVLISAVIVGAMVLTQQAEPAPGQAYAVARPGTEDLARVAASRVFFAHQSVGQNVLDGLPGLYEGSSVRAPSVADVQSAAPGPGIRDVLIGVNGDPLGKIADFDRMIRSGAGQDVDVALLKLCYLDITESTDVVRVFNTYRDTLRQLQEDFPEIRFVAVTVPLTTERTWKRRIKAIIGKDPALGPRDNVARERMNALIRAQFEPPALFDLAAVESSRDDGTRVAFTRQANTYYSLNPEYSSDGSHLNEKASKLTAGAFVHAISTSMSVG